MIYVILVVAALVIGIVIYRASLGIKYSVDELGVPIMELLKRGYDKGFLIVQQARTKDFFHFVKYIKSNGEYGIELYLLYVEENESFITEWKSLLDTLKIRYQIDRQLIERTNALRVDCGHDTQMAKDLCRRLCKDFWDMNDKDFLRVSLDGASVRDTLIDSIDKSREDGKVSVSEMKEALLKSFRKVR